MTRPAVGVIAPLIRVGGLELPAAVLRSLIGMNLRCPLRLASRARLEFLDDGFAISAGGTFSLGSTVEIETPSGDKLFTGEVTGVELDMDRGAPNLTVIADDVAYKMTLGNKTRTFTEVTYATIVETVAREYGMTANCTPTSAVQSYVLQADSDFGFLTEMADRAGYDWWVDASGVLQFHPMGSATGTIPTVGWSGPTRGLRQFSVRASALHPQKVTATGWDPATQQAIESVSGTVTPEPTSDFVTPFLHASALSSNSAASTAFHQFDKLADGAGFATSAATRAQAGAVVATGVCSANPAILVGHPISVVDVGPASGTYYVTEVEHSYSLTGFTTAFTAGDREPTSLVDTLASSAPSSFRQDMLVVGVVTNLGDSTTPAGHVKVRFPTLGTQIESAWARVVATGAGASRGMTFLPEVNDEVIVGFEGGDVARPLVLGGLYSGRSAALDYGAADGTVAKRQIVSRLGHVIELGDGTSVGDQHIWMTLAGGEFYVKLGKDGLTAAVPEGQPVTIQAGRSSMVIDKQGNITLSGNKITLKAEQDVEISGLNVKLKADIAVEESATQVKATGTSQAELSSGGQTSVKGSVVMIN